MNTWRYLVKTSAALMTFAMFVAMTSVYSQTVGNEYQNWCAHHATSERLSEPKRERYIRECMESLAAADTYSGKIEETTSDLKADDK